MSQPASESALLTTAEMSEIYGSDIGPKLVFILVGSVLYTRSGNVWAKQPPYPTPEAA